MGIKCPKCHFENPTDTKFCGECGTPIHPSEEIFVSRTRTILKSIEELVPGTTLAGKYKIIEVLGRGGMGIVYKAEDTKLKRNVALKFLPPELIQNEEAKERFVLEAQAAAALSHPNVCTIHEIDEEEDRSFIAMEYVDGQSLRAKIEKGPLELDEALNISIQVAEGLEEAHKKGIIHRDIKSANIMVTDRGQAKIMDFGLAKVKRGTLLTREGTTLGTVAYMSPEQARGEVIDHRSDIWSLGVVIYEMLTGQLPFKGDREASILYSVVHEEPKLLKEIKRDLPPELQQIINRALKKKPESRYSSAPEISKDLKKYQDSLRAEEMGAFYLRTLLRRIRRPQIAVPAVIMVLAISLFAVWFFNRQTKIRWAREIAPPEIAHLIEGGDYFAAFRLAQEVERLIPDESALTDLWPLMSEVITIQTTPAQADVYIKPYSLPEDVWEHLGQTPLEDVRVPSSLLRFKIEKPGFETEWRAPHLIILPNLNTELSPTGSLPPGMVRIKGGRAFGWLARLDPFLGATLDDYFMDRYEITNRKFKEFVDAGGYRDRKYWKHPFVGNERSLSWEEAMEVFRDSTGRSGPATWELGTYPEGKGDYPVGGMCWYEAAAYAEFADKSLPTVFHWVYAAGIWNSSEITPLSHFGTSAPSPVGSSAGMGLFGTLDMAGNVREWCWNDSGKGRYILGGAWDDQAYMFRNASVRPPFDRSAQNGFRCVRYLGEKEPSIEASRTLALSTRDYRKEQPVNDGVYKILRENFAYDPTPLNAVVEAVDDTPEHWKREKISFDAAYDNERVLAYLFLPRSSRPPFQTVVYYPGTGATMSDSFDSTIGKWELSLIDFLIRDGRALVYPILKATHERNEGLESTWPNPSHRYAEYLTCWVKDIRRTIDYLETRQDIDMERLAYFGFSWGARYGAIVPAVEDRLKVSVLVSGGLVPANARPEVDQINYVTRVTIPTLMINGRHDTTHPYETAQKTMLDLLGTPPEQKRLVNYDGGHIPPRNSMIRETLDWLDRYLRPVKKSDE